jgi:heat shock protein HslJ
MSRSLPARLATLGAVLVTAACGGATGGSGGPGGLEGAWQLESGYGPAGEVVTVEGHRITLLLEDDDVSGTSGCNLYGGVAAIEGERLSFRGLGGTEMGCEPAVMAAEARYLNALERVDRGRRAGDRLVLSGPSTELTFRTLPPVPTEALVGTTWELETVIVGSTASTPAGEATLRLAPEGTVEGSTGCRAFRGEYALRGDEVVITRLAMQELRGEACPAETAGEDALIVGVVGDRFQADVEGDQLTLRSSARHALVYRSR